MLYDIGFFIFAVFYLPTLIFKGRLHKDFLERFAVFNRAKRAILNSGRNVIWIQAVSVGEVVVCKSLIPLLKERFPKNDIVLSTITKTGNELARKLFSKIVTVIYFPLDFTTLVKKAVGIIKPRLYIMIETEIWPNLLKEISISGIPSILINGRISDRSLWKYRMIAPFLKSTLTKIDLSCMQSEADAERIISLGAPADKVKVTGNMKFDIEIKKGKRDDQDIRNSLWLNASEGLFVAGSTHRGEEAVVCDVFKELTEKFSQLKLLIAPRRIERVSEAEAIARRSGFEPVRVSQIEGQAKVMVLDTIGQLNEIYSVATIVFVGGSLVRHGGQNPIEPAVLEKAILFGPYMFNFRDIAGILLKNKGALQVSGKKDLAGKCRILLSDEGKRRRFGENAKRAVLENRGATEKNVTAIRKLIACK